MKAKRAEDLYTGSPNQVRKNRMTPFFGMNFAEFTQSVFLSKEITM
jgi:hypothetical protein